MKRYLLALAAAMLSFTSCMRIDSAMFNSTTLTSYTLADSVIPSSARVAISFASADGAKLYGYYIKSNGKHPRTTILYCHGNKDHLQYYWDRAELLYKTGCNVLIFDYQGFGMSEGTSTEEHLYADGRAALDFLRSSNSTNDTICYYGFSLGGTVAIELASHVMTPHALITESAFASADALVKSGTIIDIPHEYVIDGSYDNASKVKEIHIPYLILHGTADKFIDLAKNGQILYDNANEPKQFIKIEGADHSEIPMKMGYDTYVKTVEDWFTK